MTPRKYTLEQAKVAIANSISIRQVLLALGLADQGGNYKVISKYIKNNNIDISHFKSKGWAKGRIFGYKRPLNEYLSNAFSIESNRLKLRLLKEEIFTYICSSCNLISWLNQKIPLELDHIDGNSSNNCLENLRLLCPNCHALTDTYRGKNQKRAKLGSG